MKIKILSLNIWKGGKLWDELIAFLKKENADIVLLQEVHDGHKAHYTKQDRCLENLRAELGYTFDAFAPQFLEWKHLPDILPVGQAILSRFPIASSRGVFFDTPLNLGGTPIDTAAGSDFSWVPCNLQIAQIQIQEGLVWQVANLHGIWGFDGQDSPRRLEMARTILRELDPAMPTVLAGDSNAHDDTETCRLIGARYKYLFPDERSTSFNMRRKTEPSYAITVVDWMFTSPELNVVGHSCPDVDVSDHLPVIAEIEV